MPKWILSRTNFTQNTECCTPLFKYGGAEAAIVMNKTSCDWVGKDDPQGMKLIVYAPTASFRTSPQNCHLRTFRESVHARCPKTYKIWLLSVVHVTSVRILFRTIALARSAARHVKKWSSQGASHDIASDNTNFIHHRRSDFVWCSLASLNTSIFVLRLVS